MESQLHQSAQLHKTSQDGSRARENPFQVSLNLRMRVEPLDDATYQVEPLEVNFDAQKISEAAPSEVLDRTYEVAPREGNVCDEICQKDPHEIPDQVGVAHSSQVGIGKPLLSSNSRPLKSSLKKRTSSTLSNGSHRRSSSKRYPHKRSLLRFSKLIGTRSPSVISRRSDSNHTIESSVFYTPESSKTLNDISFTPDSFAQSNNITRWFSPGTDKRVSKESNDIECRPRKLTFNDTVKMIENSDSSTSGTSISDDECHRMKRCCSAGASRVICYCAKLSDDSTICPPQKLNFDETVTPEIINETIVEVENADKVPMESSLPMLDISLDDELVNENAVVPIIVTTPPSPAHDSVTDVAPMAGSTARSPTALSPPRSDLSCVSPSFSGVPSKAVECEIEIADPKEDSPVFFHRREMRIGFVANNVPMAVQVVLNFRTDEPNLFLEPVELFYESQKVWRRSVRVVNSEMKAIRENLRIVNPDTTVLTCSSISPVTSQTQISTPMVLSPSKTGKSPTKKATGAKKQ